MSDSAIANKSGCDWDDYGNGFNLISVSRAGAKEVAEALAKIHGSNAVEIDSHNRTKNSDVAELVFQHAGRDDSSFITGRFDPALAQTLSKTLSTRVVSLAHEDASGWTEFRIFDKGENVETYTWGADYSEEMGDEAPVMMVDDNGKDWDHRTKKDGEEFLFRSEVRKVVAREITGGETTVDAAAKAHNIWLPGWAHFPLADPKEYPDAPNVRFAGAYKVS